MKPFIFRIKSSWKNDILMDFSHHKDMKVMNILDEIDLSIALTMMTEPRTLVMKGVTWTNNDTSTVLTITTEKRTFRIKETAWANSDLSIALIMMTKPRTLVMKGVTWTNNDTSTVLTIMTE